MQNSEILIVGGGPSGLLAAHYLAADHSVTVIERGAIGATDKYWVTTRRRLAEHDLIHCVRNEPRHMCIGTFLGSRVEASGDFAVVDESRLLKALRDRCQTAGVSLFEHCSLVNLSWSNDRIHAVTTTGNVSARLLLDASGGSSPVAATFRLHRIDGFFIVYGALLSNITLHSSQIVLGYVDRLGHPPPVLEVVPCSDVSAYCVVLLYTKTLASPETLKDLFRRHCEKNPFFSISASTETLRPTFGVIPIGKRWRRELPGVAAIGEAGLAQPPMLGTAFNEVLEYAKTSCGHFSRALRDHSGLIRRPHYRYPLLKRLQDRLQLQLMGLLLDGNVETFDRLVMALRRVPPRIVFNMCSGELTSGQLAYLGLQLVPAVLKR